MTDTVPSWLLATHTPWGSTAIADGPCPTGIVWRIVRVSMSTRETTLRSRSVTHTAPAPAAIASGAPSSATLAVRASCSGSMAATASPWMVPTPGVPSAPASSAAAPAAATASTATAATAWRRRGRASARPPSAARAAATSSAPLGVAALGILVERPREHRVERVRQARAPLADARRRLLEMREDHRRLRRTGERRLAGEALEQHAAERVEVGAGVGVARAQRLGRHVQRGPGDLARCGQLVVRGLLGEAEVTQVDVVALRHEGVGRLDVAVDEPALVGGVQRGGELRHQRERPLGRERPFGRSSRSRSMPST